MGKRRKAREIVLQALYEAEFSDLSAEDILASQVARRDPSEDTSSYARSLFLTAIENLPVLDEAIESALENWDMERIAIVDKNILRFALTEILYFKEVPPKVIVNEAIEIAHRFSSDDAGRFINGLLDRFVKKYRKDFA